MPGRFIPLSDRVLASSGALVNEALSAQTIRHTVEEPTARPVSKPLTSSAPDCFGSCTCQRCKQSAHGVGHVFVRTDQRE